MGSTIMAGPLVVLESGTIEGTFNGEAEAVRIFRAIPFAAPPTGENRWRKPQPVIPWDGVLDCTRFSPACPQTDALVRMYGIAPSVLDEDCLYLNVFTPAKEWSSMATCP